MQQSQVVVVLSANSIDQQATVTTPFPKATAVQLSPSVRGDNSFSHHRNSLNSFKPGKVIQAQRLPGGGGYQVPTASSKKAQVVKKNRTTLEGIKVDLQPKEGRKTTTLSRPVRKQRSKEDRKGSGGKSKQEMAVQADGGIGCQADEFNFDLDTDLNYQNTIGSTDYDTMLHSNAGVGSGPQPQGGRKHPDFIINQQVTAGQQEGAGKQSHILGGPVSPQKRFQARSNNHNQSHSQLLDHQSTLYNYKSSNTSAPNEEPNGSSFTAVSNFEAGKHHSQVVKNLNAPMIDGLTPGGLTSVASIDVTPQTIGGGNPPMKNVYSPEVRDGSIVLDGGAQQAQGSNNQIFIVIDQAKANQHDHDPKNQIQTVTTSAVKNKKDLQPGQMSVVNEDATATEQDDKSYNAPAKSNTSSQHPTAAKPQSTNRSNRTIVNLKSASSKQQRLLKYQQERMKSEIVSSYMIGNGDGDAQSNKAVSISSQPSGAAWIRLKTPPQQLYMATALPTSGNRSSNHIGTMQTTPSPLKSMADLVRQTQAQFGNVSPQTLAVALAQAEEYAELQARQEEEEEDETINLAVGPSAQASKQQHSSYLQVTDETHGHARRRATSNTSLAFQPSTKKSSANLVSLMVPSAARPSGELGRTSVQNDPEAFFAAQGFSKKRLRQVELKKKARDRRLRRSVERQFKELMRPSTVMTSSSRMTLVSNSIVPSQKAAHCTAPLRTQSSGVGSQQQQVPGDRRYIPQTTMQIQAYELGDSPENGHKKESLLFDENFDSRVDHIITASRGRKSGNRRRLKSGEKRSGLQPNSAYGQGLVGSKQEQGRRSLLPRQSHNGKTQLVYDKNGTSGTLYLERSRLVSNSHTPSKDTRSHQSRKVSRTIAADLVPAVDSKLQTATTQELLQECGSDEAITSILKPKQQKESVSPGGDHMIASIMTQEIEDYGEEEEEEVAFCPTQVVTQLRAKKTISESKKVSPSKPKASRSSIKQLSLSQKKRESLQPVSKEQNQDKGQAHEENLTLRMVQQDSLQVGAASPQVAAKITLSKRFSTEEDQAMQASFQTPDLQHRIIKASMVDQSGIDVGELIAIQSSSHSQGSADREQAQTTRPDQLPQRADKLTQSRKSRTVYSISGSKAGYGKDANRSQEGIADENKSQDLNRRSVFQRSFNREKLSSESKLSSKGRAGDDCNLDGQIALNNSLLIETMLASQNESMSEGPQEILNSAQYMREEYLTSSFSKQNGYQEKANNHVNLYKSGQLTMLKNSLQSQAYIDDLKYQMHIRNVENESRSQSVGLKLRAIAGQRKRKASLGGQKYLQGPMPLERAKLNTNQVLPGKQASKSDALLANKDLFFTAVAQKNRRLQNTGGKAGGLKPAQIIVQNPYQSIERQQLSFSSNGIETQAPSINVDLSLSQDQRTNLVQKVGDEYAREGLEDGVVLAGESPSRCTFEGSITKGSLGRGSAVPTEADQSGESITLLINQSAESQAINQSMRTAQMAQRLKINQAKLRLQSNGNMSAMGPAAKTAQVYPNQRGFERKLQANLRIKAMLGNPNSDVPVQQAFQTGAKPPKRSSNNPLRVISSHYRIPVPEPLAVLRASNDLGTTEEPAMRNTTDSYLIRKTYKIPRLSSTSIGSGSQPATVKNRGSKSIDGKKVKVYSVYNSLNRSVQSPARGVQTITAQPKGAHGFYSTQTSQQFSTFTASNGPIVQQLQRETQYQDGSVKSRGSPWPAQKQSKQQQLINNACKRGKNLTQLVLKKPQIKTFPQSGESPGKPVELQQQQSRNGREVVFHVGGKDRMAQSLSTPFNQTTGQVATGQENAANYEYDSQVRLVGSKFNNTSSAIGSQGQSQASSTHQLMSSQLWQNQRGGDPAQNMSRTLLTDSEQRKGRKQMQLNRHYSKLLLLKERGGGSALGIQQSHKVGRYDRRTYSRQKNSEVDGNAAVQNTKNRTSESLPVQKGEAQHKRYALESSAESWHALNPSGQGD